MKTTAFPDDPDDFNENTGDFADRCTPDREPAVNDWSMDDNWSGSQILDVIHRAQLTGDDPKKIFEGGKRHAREILGDSERGKQRQVRFVETPSWPKRVWRWVTGRGTLGAF